MYLNFEAIVEQNNWYNYVAENNFENIALSLFHFQYKNNALYRSYCELIRKTPEVVNALIDIPFLPIHFFKTHTIKTTSFDAKRIFESSGTTGTINSKHHIKDTQLYLETCINGFEEHFGKIEGKAILCLMPSYLERNNSSLVLMAEEMVRISKNSHSGFYLYDFESLKNKIEALSIQNIPIILFGVTFALLDFAKYYPKALKNIQIIETGGMKGRKEEWTRTQVHDYLKKQWHQEKIYSEYGMTELLSQAYCTSNEIFKPIATLKVLVRDLYDPLTTIKCGKGAINVIDLSNIYSCSFIATEDLGEVYEEGNFEVKGRIDISSIRGCSLMAI
jgi:phenylacetate-coenzyme A ligase PaaK-like adenylate-forming protein